MEPAAGKVEGMLQQLGAAQLLLNLAMVIGVGRRHRGRDCDQEHRLLHVVSRGNEGFAIASARGGRAIA